MFKTVERKLVDRLWFTVASPMAWAVHPSRTKGIAIVITKQASGTAKMIR